MKKIFLLIFVIIITSSSASALSDLTSFTVRPFTSKEFFTFLKVFGKMRGPLRVQILKDRKTNFEDADPLKYLNQIRNEKKVKKVLKKSDLTWEQFMELTGNVLLAYYSVQPDETKIAIIKRLADYGLTLSDDQIPPEYQPLIHEFVKTDAGAALANMALEMFLQIPPENTAIIERNKLTLDKQFYTKFWKNKLSDF
jgi:hypothetical protein